ncbi:50S ribosome-binding GTPase [Staphylococcus aureus]|nr:FeoB small GTPase domain-containing protein [Staphylococcus aureus]MCZ4811243.1 50S ribosome-binding GTPase [Staphylococcus aureus]MCZ4952168.1 50S ribosome-binding GTPase [Staphylococcus aureus]
MENYCILGNPNVGKTSLFNALTGSYEYMVLHLLWWEGKTSCFF